MTGTPEDQERWKQWAERRRSEQTARVEVKAAQDVTALRTLAVASPANFARNPLGLLVPPHHEEWYRLSQLYATDPKYRKVLILAPTDWGKSTVWGLTVPIYEIVKDRAIQIGLVGSDMPNAKRRLATIVRQITGNRALVEGFGHRGSDGVARFKPQKRVDRWTTEEVVVEGAAEAAEAKGIMLDNATLAVFGWESHMEGRHWDLAICDDVVDYQEAQSALRRAQYLDWYLNVFTKRVRPDAREVWIATRAHSNDLYQYIMDSGKYTVIDFPQALEVGPDGKEASTWEERHTTASLIEERELDPVSFELKRMNKIVGGSLSEFDRDQIELCKDKDLRYYGNSQNFPNGMKAKNLAVYIGVDLATGFTLESKFFVVYVVGVDRATGDRYLLHLVRGKFSTSDQKAAVKEAHAAWGAVKILVENNGTQRYFYEDSFEGLPVHGLNTGNNKVDLGEGIPSLVALIKAKKLHIPWGDAHAQFVSGPFVKEMLDYPKGETTDCVMAWWFAEREIRQLFLSGAKIQEHRNFFRRQAPRTIRQAGGFLHRRYGRG